MYVDLAAAAATQNASKGGGASATWVGGKIEIDDAKMLDLIARAISFVMGNNLFEGRRPDGRGPMPPRQYDGQPRGSGSAIARAIAAVKTGPLVWLIAAHREKIGHLARIMGNVPLLAPPIDTIRNAVHAAFVASVKVSAQKAANAGLATKFTGRGAVAAAARASARAEARGLRDAYRSQLGALGIGGDRAERSALGKRIASAGRRAVRSATSSRGRR